MAGWSDDSLRRLRAGIARLDSAGRIADRIIHVENGDMAIGSAKNGGPVGARGRRGIPPVKRESLPSLAADLRHAHPDDGPASIVVPGLDLVGKQLT